jgi:hypothetical protein
MALNVEPRTGGDFIPYLKYNAKAGRWYTKLEDGGEQEVANMTAIFDLAQIKTGWVFFADGQAPNSVWDNGSTAPQPTPQHRRGFALVAFSPKELGGAREFSSTSNAAIIAVKELYEEQYETAPEAARGLLPVVRCEKVVPVKSRQGTNYQPVLKITKWVPRPQALPLNGNEGNATAADAGSEVPPPVAAAQRQATPPPPAAAASEEEF